MLVENQDEIANELGYDFQTGEPAEPEPVSNALEWWAILLICVGGLAVILVMYFFYRNTRVDVKG